MCSLLTYNIAYRKIFVEFGGNIFQKIIGIHMGTNCAHVIDGLLIYSYTSIQITTDSMGNYILILVGFVYYLIFR